MRDTHHQTTRPWRRVVTDGIVLASFAAITIAMLMTVGDVLIRLAAESLGALTGARPKWGLFGLVDLTQLAMMAAAPLAIAAAFFLDKHIRVDLFYGHFSQGLKCAALHLSAAIGTVLMGICLWTAWNEMRGQLDFTTTSSTLGIAYTWYWAPLIAGLALSVVGCCVALVWPQADEEHDV